MTRATRTEIEDGILTLTLSRPDAMNTFNLDMMTEILAAFDRADADDAVRAVIVTGDGERAFCAGADLSMGAQTFDYANNPQANSRTARTADGAEDWSDPKMRDRGGVVTMRIFRSKKPVIGAINGAAVGIGATMTLPMDVRIASDHARFGFVFARRGIVPEAASSWFLPRIVGISTALQWCMSGRLIPALEARDKGLVQDMVSSTDLLPAAREIARQLTAESAPVSVALTRAMLWRMMGAAHPMEAHRLDSRVIRSRGASADAKEGVTSFLEKRPARFSDSVANDLPDFPPWLDNPEW